MTTEPKPANFIPQTEIDAGAEALRQAQQGGKQLTPWASLPNSTKKKWRMYSVIVLSAAAAERAQ